MDVERQACDNNEDIEDREPSSRMRIKTAIADESKMQIFKFETMRREF